MSYRDPRLSGLRKSRSIRRKGRQNTVSNTVGRPS